MPRIKKQPPARLIVTLPQEEHAWLAEESALRAQSMAGIVRDAVAEYRSHLQSAKSSSETFRNLLQETAGVWEEGDGLAYTQKIRDEWGS